MMFMKVKEGAQTKTVKGKEKGKEMDPALEPADGMPFCGHLGFSPGSGF